MKRSLSCRIFLLTALLLLGAQVQAATPQVKVEPGTGLAFGSFDITESDLAVTHVVLLRIKPTKMYMGSSGERETVTYTNGDFFAPNLSPGLYAVNGFFSGGKFFALEKSLRQNTFLIEAGRVVYAGSYKLKLEKGGLFRRDKGSFVRIGSLDTERQLLEWLAKELAATGWASEIDARLSERRR